MDRNYTINDILPQTKLHVNRGLTKRLSLRIGKITSVDPDNNLVNISWLFPLSGGMQKLDISRAYVGFNSGVNFCPEVGSVVVVGFAEDFPVLLTYILPSNFQNMLQGLENNEGVTTGIRKLNPGEISLNSVQGSEIYLSQQVSISDFAQDQIILNPKDGSINLDSLQFYVTNEAGTIVMGMAERNINGANTIITNDGQPVSSTNGGNALNELVISVNKFSNNTINDNTSNQKVAEVTMGTLIDDSGNQTKSSDNANINLQIKMNSGINVTFDENGGVFINDKKINITSTDSITVNSKNNTNITSDNINLKSNKKANVNSDDSINISSKNTANITSNNISLNNGNQLQGAARLNDLTTTNPTTDPLFYTWIAAVTAVVNGISPGAAIPPISISGKISSASSSVQIG